MRECADGTASVKALRWGCGSWEKCSDAWTQRGDGSGGQLAVSLVRDHENLGTLCAVCRAVTSSDLLSKDQCGRDGMRETSEEAAAIDQGGSRGDGEKSSGGRQFWRWSRQG